jgi:hypothetical protein
VRAYYNSFFSICVLLLSFIPLVDAVLHFIRNMMTVKSLRYIVTKVHYQLPTPWLTIVHVYIRRKKQSPKRMFSSFVASIAGDWTI